MKKICITYDCYYKTEAGTFAMGETCYTLEVMEHVADNLVTSGRSGLANADIEKALHYIERLKGRTYIKGSIKSFEYD